MCTRETLLRISSYISLNIIPMTRTLACGWIYKHKWVINKHSVMAQSRMRGAAKGLLRYTLPLAYICIHVKEGTELQEGLGWNNPVRGPTLHLLGKCSPPHGKAITLCSISGGTLYTMNTTVCNMILRKDTIAEFLGSESTHKRVYSMYNTVCFYDSVWRFTCAYTVGYSERCGVLCCCPSFPNTSSQPAMSRSVVGSHGCIPPLWEA